MSISGAMSSALSGMKAQSQALAIISDNIVNANTTGYKASTVSFSTLVTEQNAGTHYSSGGVISSARQDVSQQGLISSTDIATDLAIDGNGMFVVTYGADGDEFLFTRNGEFDIDSDGMLYRGNYYLMGWPTDGDGNVIGGTVSTLEAIDVNRISGYASATTTETVEANLPADAEIGDTFSTNMCVYDSLGVIHDVEMSWEKTAVSTWSLSLSDPSLVSDPTVTSGTIAGGPFTVTFADGMVDTIVPSPATVTIAGWSSGASDSTISLDLGASGTSNRLSQFASNKEPPTLDVTAIVPDGLPYGTLSSIEVAEDGTVMAKYDNGHQTAIYKIPVATFGNVDGLIAQSDGTYAQSTTSGSFTLQTAGHGTAGVIYGYAAEGSTVDTAEELTNLIIAQHAYSAAAQVITTGRDMFDTLLSAVR